MRTIWMLSLASVAACCVVALGVGCGGVPPTPCDELALADCTDACVVISGRTVRTEQDGACFADQEQIACDEPDACPAVESTAAPADDPTQCMLFGGCIPAGWVPCDPDPGDVIEECPR